MPNNPNAVKNLIPPKKGEIRNPKGKPKGIVNKSTILQYLLYEVDMSELGVIKNKPEWWDKVKPKTMYEIMLLAQGVKAMGGDTQAFNAINNAIGDNNKGDLNVNVIFANNVPRPDRARTKLPGESKTIDISPKPGV